MAQKDYGRRQASAPAKASRNGGERKPPAHEVRVKTIRAVVWENTHPEQGKWYSVSIVRSYKQGTEWKSAQTFGRDDLLVVAEVARLAWLWIAEQQGPNGQRYDDVDGGDDDLPI